MAEILKSFRAGSGLDAANEKVINVAKADKHTLSDGVNVEFFIEHNNSQQYDTTRGYDQYHAVIFNNRLYYAVEDIAKPAGAFNATKWQALRTDPNWDYVAQTPVSGKLLVVGDYITADNKFANLLFMMPIEPKNGDNITVKDIGGKPGVNDLLFRSEVGHKFVHNGQRINDFRSTTPFAMTTFIFVNNEWVVYQTGTEPRGSIVSPSAEPYQMQNGEEIYRRSRAGKIVLRLPKHANHGDTIHLFDLDGETPLNHVTMQIHPDSGHFINVPGTGQVVSRSSGNGTVVYDANDNLWRLWDGDLRTRAEAVTDSRKLVTNGYYAVYGDANVKNNVVLTLPTAVAYGDNIKISMMYMYGDQTCTITTDDNTKIAITKNMLQFPQRRSYPPSAGWESVDSLTFSAKTDYVTYIEFAYIEVSGVGVWAAIDNNPMVERVDANNRSRVGVISLATQSEVDKNHEQNPSDEQAVTPLTLARSTANESRRGIARIATTAEVNQNTGATFLNDVIVTPKKLNECTATEDRRGVAEVATQAEVNGNSDDSRFITSKKLNARRATETLAGIGAIVVYGGKPGLAREQAGTGIFNKADHAKFVTPKTLDEMRADEANVGLVFVATESEVISGSISPDKQPLVVTAENLHKKTSTEGRIGLIEIATQEETNTGADDVRAITPKKLHGRTATETRTGIAEIATDQEFEAGTDNSRIVTPLKAKNFFGSQSRLVTNVSSGLNHTGNIWNGVSLSIAQASETQKGSARLATQTEVNAGTSADTLVTPKTLHAKKTSTTAEGIIRIATRDEAVAGSSTNLAICPATLKSVMQSGENWQATETRRGPVNIATLANCFTGNDTAGSTQPATSYQHDGYSVSPRGLHTALANYLPKMATAQNSLKLGGVVAADWVRRTTAQTITGKFTYNADVQFNNPIVVSNTAKIKELNVAGNSGGTLHKFACLSVGTNAAEGYSTIAFNAKHTTLGNNNWSIWAGGGSATSIKGDEFSIATANEDGAFNTQVFKLTRSGNATLVGSLTATSLTTAQNGVIRLGDQQLAALSGDTVIRLGNTNRDFHIYTGADVNSVKINHHGGAQHTVLTTGNYVDQLKGKFVERGGSTMTGTLNMQQAAVKFDVAGKAATEAPGAMMHGIWTASLQDSAITNTYPGKTLGLLTNISMNEHRIVQLWSPKKTHKHYIRSGGDQQWTAWGEIYTTQNKPTAADIGAIVSGGVTSSLTVTDFIKIGNCKIIANNVTRTVDFVWES